MKDPAFLFYSNDFYTGTRTMLPEERACYIDLLIYQHQNRYIPDDLRRVMMFCTGIDEDTLLNVLKEKFKKTENGWVNMRLNSEHAKRTLSARRKSILAVLGNFIKNKKLNSEQKKFIKNQFEISKYLEIENKDERIILINKDLNKLAKRYAKRTLLENENINEIENENINIYTINQKIKKEELTPKSILLSPENKLWLEVITKNSGQSISKILKMLEQYNLKKMSDPDFDIHKYSLNNLRAGFQKWINSWISNESKKAIPKTEPNANKELEKAYS